MTRLLILSSDTGEGHNSAASAVESAARAGGFDPSIRKPLEESGRWNRLWGSTYNTLLAHHPQWMRAYFGLIERFRPNERDIFYSKARKFIGRFLDSEKPDVLLSVHPMLNHFIQRFIKEERLSIPSYTFLTDPFPPFWRGWASPYVDRYFVPTSDALQALSAMGIPAWKIERVPMPVRPQFQPLTMTELNAFRNELRLGDANTILINGGARGGGPLFDVYQRIRPLAENLNVLVICGRNHHLREQLEKVKDPHTRTFGYVEDIHRYVGASDLVVTKPGALSTFEALACGVPVLLLAVGGVMTQEAGLFQAARHYDFGFGALTLDDVAHVIEKGPREWNRIRGSLAQFYKGSSGRELIERIQPDHVRA